MKVTLIEEKDQHTSRWSGGTTTELYILPAGSKYQNRDFILRLSTATIEEEKSVFTKLPAIRRILSVLEGEVAIQHGNGPRLFLKAGEIHAFGGDEDTVSWGQCRDFNVMVKPGLQVDLRVYKAGQLPPAWPADFVSHFFYAYRGEYSLQCDGTDCRIPEKALLYLPRADRRFSLLGPTTDEALLVHVSYQAENGKRPAE